MYLPLILLGLPCVALGIWYWMKARRTPKNKLIAYGMSKEVWITHRIAYVLVIFFFYLAALFFILGLIL